MHLTLVCLLQKNALQITIKDTAKIKFALNFKYIYSVKHTKFNAEIIAMYMYISFNICNAATFSFHTIKQQVIDSTLLFHRVLDILLTMDFCHKTQKRWPSSCTKGKASTRLLLETIWEKSES